MARLSVQNRFSMKAAPGDTATAALRRKLWRRLLWKVPLIVLLVTFAVWWESRKQQRDGATDAAAAAFTGAWSGEVSYGDGARFNERFFFSRRAASSSDRPRCGVWSAA